MLKCFRRYTPLVRELEIEHIGQYQDIKREIREFETYIGNANRRSGLGRRHCEKAHVYIGGEDKPRTRDDQIRN